MNDSPKVPPSARSEFERQMRAAASALQKFLETDPRFAFKRTSKNKYMTGWEILDGTK